MDRRSFLRRSTIALAGGLVLGDAALEAFERLTHRKVFALGAPPKFLRSRLLPPGYEFYIDKRTIARRTLSADIDFVYFDAVTSRVGMAIPKRLIS